MKRYLSLGSSLRSLCALGLLCSVSISQAAVEGNLGLTSSGRVVVSLSVVALIKLSGLNDVSLKYDYTSTADYTRGETTACVYTNSPVDKPQYQVTVTGDDGFSVKNNAGDKIGFDAYWTDKPSSQDMGLSLASGSTSSGYEIPADESPDCSGNPDARFTVRFANDDLAKAQPGLYTGHVTITVKPT